MVLFSVALFPNERKYDTSWLYMAFTGLSPGCLSLRVNQAWTCSFVHIMRTRGTEVRILPAQFECLVETGQTETLFFLPNRKKWQMGLTLNPAQHHLCCHWHPYLLSTFVLKGRGLGLAIRYNLALLPHAFSSHALPLFGCLVIHKALTQMNL